MKILVTGASGMVGKALIEALNSQKEQVLAPTRKELDYADKDAVLKYFEKHRPDFVYHLAAKVGGIQANINDPVGFFYENMQINLNVVHAAYATHVKYFVNVGSSCMYPRNRELLKEDELMSGELEPTNEGYAFSKLASFLFCKYIEEQFGVTYKTIIPSNLYGPYDHFDLIKGHLIPAIILKLSNAKINHAENVVIWGDGIARREFMHVDDLIAALLRAKTHYENMPSVMNIGLGRDYSVNEYYQIAAKIINYDGAFTHDVNKPAGMQKKLLDITRAKAWGWQPQISIEEGIQQVYQYVTTHKIIHH